LLNYQLAQLRRKSNSPTDTLEEFGSRIQSQLQVNRHVEIKLSATVTSPFVCGLLKPTIILPQSLVIELEPAELSALLNHEFAHIRQHDLRWCVAWQWMKAITWFHPLMWAAPNAHNLACEQEADRIASGQQADTEPYSRLLARLALRVLALPPLETKLTLNGSSQIAQRLRHLGRQGKAAWNRKHSIIGIGLAGTLLILPAACQFTESTSYQSKSVKFKNVLVEVISKDGQPIEGATISPTGFRVGGTDSASAFRWNQGLFGPPEDAVTDLQGKAYVKYPVEGRPEERQHTEKLIFGVSHPEYSRVYIQGFSVNQSEKPIELIRGIRLEVSGYFGAERWAVPELIPTLNEEMIRPEDWKKNDDASLTFTEMSPGSHLLRLMGRLATGEIVFSDSIGFTAEVGEEYKFDLELEPGIRVEGRLDDNVPRPVKNGRALISIRPKEFPAWTNYKDVADVFEQYPHTRSWQSYRLIEEDGSFVFESVPPGGLDVTVQGDGFVSQNGGEFSKRTGSGTVKIPGFALPQAFELDTPITKIEIKTEATATLEFTTKTRWGKPIEGATLQLSPNIVRMTGILGTIDRSHEAPFRKLVPLPDPPYSALTDESGMAVLKNVPATAKFIQVFHPDFQAPLQKYKRKGNRFIQATLSPGTTNRFNLTLQRKGRDYIGNN